METFTLIIILCIDIFSEIFFFSFSSFGENHLNEKILSVYRPSWPPTWNFYSSATNIFHFNDTYAVLWWISGIHEWIKMRRWKKREKKNSFLFCSLANSRYLLRAMLNDEHEILLHNLSQGRDFHSLFFSFFHPCYDFVLNFLWKTNLNFFDQNV